VHGSNAKNLSVQLVLSQTSKNALFLIIAYVFYSTKLEKRAEQVLPGSKGVEGEAGSRNGPNSAYTYE
jgi:hypothetical protein